MHKILVACLMVFLHLRAVAADTSLVKMVTSPSLISQMALGENGYVLIERNDGIFEFNGEGFQPSALNFKRTSKLLAVSVDHLEDDLSLSNFSQDEIFLDKKGIYWVCLNGKFLLGYRINHSFTKESHFGNVVQLATNRNQLVILSKNQLFEDGNSIATPVHPSEIRNIAISKGTVLVASINKVFTIAKGIEDWKTIFTLENAQDSIIDMVPFGEEFLVLTNKYLSILEREGALKFQMPNELQLNQFLESDSSLFLSNGSGIFDYTTNYPNNMGNWKETFFVEDAVAMVSIGEVRYAIGKKEILKEEKRGKWAEWMTNQNFNYKSILGAIKDDYGFLYLLMENGLIRLDPQNLNWSEYLSTIPMNKQAIAVFRGKIYLGTAFGLYQTSQQDLIFTGTEMELEEKLSPLWLVVGLLSLLLGIGSWVGFKRRKSLNKEEEKEVEREFTFEEQVEIYVKENIDDINVDELREHLNLTRYMFYNLFDQNFGVSPKVYINQIKKEYRIQKSDKNLSNQMK